MKPYLTFLALGLLTACAPTPTPTTPAIAPVPTDVWTALQTRFPQPFAQPLPAQQTTPIDGLFAKINPDWPEWWQCLRCADYRPAGGIWKLRFDRGVMRVFYDVTGWHSLASYTVEGDRLFLFNDPYCPQVTGEYRWRIEDRWGLADRALILELVDDPCSIDLRGENLAAQEWFNCGPPSAYTGASDHYHREPACQTLDKAQLLADAPLVPDGLTLTIYPNYVKHFTAPPELLINASLDAQLPPGYTLTTSDTSIPYGLNRVLWGLNDWLQLDFDSAAQAVGVQIYGKHTMGWARVLFDGQEVWRGDTLALGQEKDFFGGYIQVSGFEPGPHALRVESIGTDYRPVTIALFGLSLNENVQP
jgi:hypothetical protein